MTTTNNERPSRVQRIAEMITDLWPHRMSGQAADAIAGTYLAEMAAEVREVNTANGWHDLDRTFGDGIALLHSEVSEALEAFRSWRYEDATQPGGKPEGIGSEFADVLIRLLDECDRAGIDLEAEYRRKIAHNRTRGYRHGGRTL